MAEPTPATTMTVQQACETNAMMQANYQLQLAGKDNIIAQLRFELATKQAEVVQLQVSSCVYFREIQALRQQLERPAAANRQSPIQEPDSSVNDELEVVLSQLDSPKLSTSVTRFAMNGEASILTVQDECQPETVQGSFCLFFI